MTAEPEQGFRRMACLTCGAHALVRASQAADARCEVCGSAELNLVEERPPAG
jgi:ribosomal protein S27E